MKKDWPIYFNQIRRLLALKGLTPVSARSIDIIGNGWRSGVTALTVANRVIAYEFQAEEDARNAAHDE
jgi:hypothetical protein